MELTTLKGRSRDFRRVHLQMRITPREEEYLIYKADLEGVPKHEYIRKVLFGGLQE